MAAVGGVAGELLDDVEWETAGHDVELHGVSYAGGKREGKGAGTAHLASRPGDGVGVGEREVWDAAQPGLDGHPQFHAGEVGAQAAVDPDSEREVPVDLAVEDHAVGLVEDGGVAVPGGEREQDPVARVHGATADDGVLDDLACHGDGCEHPQELLGGGVDEVGLVDESAPVVGVGGEVEERRPDRGPGGVDAGEEQEDAHAEDLGVLEGAAVRHAGVEEVGDDVVTRGCAVILDVAGEVPADLEDGVEGGVAGERALFDETVDPVPEPGVVAVGDPEHPGDDLDGDVLGVVRSGVAFPACR